MENQIIECKETKERAEILNVWFNRFNKGITITINYKGTKEELIYTSLEKFFNDFNIV